jgi:chromatin structure-remodeling complex protein RSC7
MLAIDAARTSGFRDSLYYFRRNLLALKLNATQPEKDYLIAEGKLGSHLRTRSVTLVTARSAFKLHGSKTIFGWCLLVASYILTDFITEGRWVTDDYYEDKVLADITEKGLKAGDPVGELPDPSAPAGNNELNALTAAAAAANKAERGGGGGVYRAGGPTTIFGGSGMGPYSDGPLNAVRKSLLSRDGVAEDNWMWMMATRVSEANEGWAKQRAEARQRLQEAGNVSTEASQGNAQVDMVMDPVTAPKAKKRKTVIEPAWGIYEPHSDLTLCTLLHNFDIIIFN